MSEENQSQCLKVLVSGHVQGVCFRHFTRMKARELGISGWVKNLPSGHVEVLIYGSPEQLDAMLAWLAHGPDNAQVSGCKARPFTGPAPSDGFHISYK